MNEWMTSDRDRPFTIGFNGSRAFTLNDDDRDAIEFNEKMWASGLKYNWKDGGSSTIKTELVEDKWSVEFYTVGVKAWVEALEWC